MNLNCSSIQCFIGCMVYLVKLINNLNFLKKDPTCDRVQKVERLKYTSV